MKSSFITLFLMLFSFLCYSQFIWQNPKPQGNSLHSVAFTDANTGIAVGDWGTILKTTDGGNSWTRMPNNYYYSLKSVCFTHPDTGFIAANTATQGLLLKTTNGGNSWTDIGITINYHVNAVYFLNSIKGYLIGENGVVRRTINGGNTWLNSSSNTSEELYDIVFTDENTGYIVGYNGLILKTTNAGQNWSALSSGTTAGLRSIFFTDANTGYAVGNSGTMIKTTDAGATWGPLSSGGYTTNFNDVLFLNSNSGFVIDYLRILKTTNGGSTWLPVYNKGGNALNFVNATGYFVGDNGVTGKTINSGTNWSTLSSATSYVDIYSICFPTKNTGLATGLGKIYRTNNGGNTWSLISPPASQQIFTICFTDSMKGYAAGNGALIKTLDQGITWTTMLATTPYFLTGIYFPSPDTGYTCGAGGKILKTADGGTNWTLQPAFTSHDLNSVFFTSNDTGFVVSEDNNQYHGEIFRTTDGGATWTTTVFNNNFHYVYFTNHDTGYAVGSMGLYTMTVNGGDTWTQKNLNYIGGGLTSIHFADKDTGYITGDYILKTVDAGNNWYRLPHIPTYLLNSLFFTDGSTGYFVGNSGRILKTVQGGIAEPMVIWQPADDTTCVNGIGSFNMHSIGPAPMNYQWMYEDSGTYINVVNGTPLGAIYSNEQTPTLGIQGIYIPGNYNYRCSVSNNYGISTSSYAIYTILPDYHIQNSPTICDGSSYSYNGHTYSTSGVYYDTLTTISGCDSVIETQLTIIPDYNVNLDSINGGSNDTLYVSHYPTTIDAGSSYQHYLWNTGSTNQTTTVFFDGWYILEVSNDSGCSDLDSIYIYLSTFSKVNSNKQGIAIIPNPNNGQFTICFDSYQYIDKLEIFDILGNNVCSINVNKKQSMYKIDIFNLPNGIYFLKIFEKEKCYIEKMLKQ